MKRLIIIGASGHGKVVADLARLNGYDDIVFLDGDTAVRECAGKPVLGPDTMAPEIDGDVFVAVGNAGARKRLMERNAGRSFPVLIHPSAVVAEGAVIGEGSAVMAGAVINTEARIGRGCIVNTSSSVDHDCEVGDYCHIAVGAHLCGTVAIGNETWIGAGAVVSNNVSICGKCTVGAGAVVVRDISEPGVYVGVPVHRTISTKRESP